VVFFGLLINRRLERSKLLLAKEKEWESQWAERLLSRSVMFNDAAEDCVMLLFQIGELSKNQDDAAVVRMNEKVKLIWEARDRLQRAEWSLKIHLQFTPDCGKSVLVISSEVYSKIAFLLENKRGELDPITEALGRFNVAVRNAHREVLSL
jgi:hypothetical protein